MAKSDTKVPCFLFNVGDFLSSPSLKRMSDRQYRVYTKLLFISWLEEPRATLPNDSAELALLADISVEEFEQIKDKILAKFEADGNGRIFNSRLMRESKLLEKKSKAGQSGWTQKRRKALSKSNATRINIDENEEFDADGLH